MIAEAIRLGYTPIIDMQHHDNQYFKDGRKFKDNVWEYYFKQPCGLGLNDIYTLKDNDKIRVFTQDYFIRGEYVPIKVPRKKDEADNFPHKAIIGKYFDLSDEAKSFVDKNIIRVFGKIGKDEKMLGILCRGTDYVYKRPYGHCIPATPEQLIKEAKELKEKFGYTKIYVATEDLDVYDKFKKEFSDLMLPNTQYMYRRYKNADTKFLAEVKIGRENHNYRLGMEYLASMFMLSKCRFFIANCRCGGLDFVSTFSNFYQSMDFVHIWDIGNYGVCKKVKYNNIFERLFSVKNEQNENIIRKVVTIFGVRIKLIKQKL